uniref:AMP-activated protein kinase glycogen-binding domain-containing protein n=1 Tax=Meloidogyne enterolobii TaxID=390850 RepID=A0A6V7VWK8_MELEN|nr:unnamed protein product [Meloidogyne enterolobii]
MELNGNNNNISVEEQLAEANRKINELLAEQQNMKTNSSNGEKNCQLLREEIIKMEKKLANANEEKEYYKRHFHGEQNGRNINGSQNNGSNTSRFINYYSDDFGKELLLANKRKYQLESRVKQLEIELKDAQQRSVRLSELFELEKAQNARLDAELLEAHKDCLETRQQLDEAVLQGNLFPLLNSVSSQGDEMRERLKNIENDYERKLQEMSEAKSKVEWRLGEVMQMYNDTKWRLGEVEALLAHRDWQLEQEKKNYQKLLENNSNDKPANSEEIQRLNDQLIKKTEEKNAADWKIGELKQLYNDAKWRVGELEAETMHRSTLLDEAHHKIGELERRLEGNLPLINECEYSKQLNEMEKKYNDTKWRLGEVEAELNNLKNREQQLNNELSKNIELKSKVEWRLGEVMQFLNDAKWRIGELEASIEHRNQQLQDINETQSELNSFKTLGGINGALIIKRQPRNDRHKWTLLTIENSLKMPLHKILLETNSNGNGDIFLIGSFLNWECALICDSINGKPNKKGVLLELPKGRHEFCFICEGKWYTESLYEDCWNEFGTKNNWIIIN